VTFCRKYRQYIRTSRQGVKFGLDLHLVARLEPVLSFLYHQWWQVDFTGLQHLPARGPALIVGNTGGPIPWPALMLLFALMSDTNRPRKLSILADMDSIQDERVYRLLMGLGFVPATADNARLLFARNQTVAVFPEGNEALLKPFTERYRPRTFEPTQILPALQAHVPLVPLATLGCDESTPVFANLEELARLLDMPAFPLTPGFPWLPFPVNLMPLPVSWKMRLLKPVGAPVEHISDPHELARAQSMFIEGEVQSELNRLLRVRVRPLF
jgi:1-acyl-sn-glycerol-3-phosphate acyltransferase